MVRDYSVPFLKHFYLGFPCSGDLVLICYAFCIESNVGQLVVFHNLSKSLFCWDGKGKVIEYVEKKEDEGKKKERLRSQLLLTAP